MLKLHDVYKGTTPGLLGMAIEPDQEKYPYLFLIYDSKHNKNNIVQKVVRYKVEDDTLSHAKKLLAIPGAKHHQGSRIKISPNGKLFIVDGDAERRKTKKNAQNVHTLVGKMLRLNIDGSIPKDNPFRGSVVWAWGFRNPKGLTLGKKGILYNSMNGPASDNEINIVKKKGNYGWPNVNGYCDKPDEKKFCADSSIVEPIKAWTPTIAPAGLTYYKSTQIPEWKNSLIVTTLKDESLYVRYLNPSGDSVKHERVFLKRKYGRLRYICVSQNGDIYISTSNRDWKPHPGKGFLKPNDDRILRLSKLKNINKPKAVSPIKNVGSDSNQVQNHLTQGATIYKNYCQSCHQANGRGIRKCSSFSKK